MLWAHKLNCWQNKNLFSGYIILSCMFCRKFTAIQKYFCPKEKFHLEGSTINKATPSSFTFYIAAFRWKLVVLISQTNQLPYCMKCPGLWNWFQQNAVGCKIILKAGCALLSEGCHVLKENKIQQWEKLMYDRRWKKHWTFGKTIKLVTSNIWMVHSHFMCPE